jgi:hypothetical protein
MPDQLNSQTKHVLSSALLLFSVLSETPPDTSDAAKQYGFFFSSCFFVHPLYVSCLRLLHDLYRSSMNLLMFCFDMLIFSIITLSLSKSTLHLLNYSYKN